MSTNPIWVAGYGTVPVAGASPVWIAGYGKAVAGAAEAWIAGWGGSPVPGATAVQIVGYGGPVAGASAIWIGGTISSAGSSGGGSTPAQDYLARTVGGNEGGNAANITTLINGLVADGVWAKLDALYLPAQQNVTDARLNLVSASYSLMDGTGPHSTFTAYKGFSGNGGDGGLDTGFDPSSAVGRQFAQNSASLSAWSYDVPAATGALINTENNSAGYSFIFPSYAGGWYSGLSSAVASSITPNNLAGFYAADRSVSTTTNVFFNGALQSAMSDTSAPTIAGNFKIGGRIATGLYWNGTISAAHIGASLGATLQLALYNRLATYMAAVATVTPAQAYLARTVGGNEGGNAANITTLIDGLVADGVWAKLDALYILAQQNATDSLLNLVGTNYTILSYGSPLSTFTAYRGYSSFPSNGGLDTRFNDTLAVSPNYTLNSASLGVWAYNVNLASTGVDIGADSVNDNILISYGGNFYVRINGSNSNNIATPGTVTGGLYAGDRSSSANIVVYFNGVSQGTQTSTSSAVVNANIVIGNEGTTSGFGTINSLSAAYIGASLGATLQLALYNRLNTYMTAVAPSHVTKKIFLTSGTTWTVPSDWNSANNTIEALGAGGGGYGASTTQCGRGGGGGEYRKAANVSLTALASIPIQIGAGGTGGAATATNGTAGTATTFNTSTVVANGGGGATASVSGVGGTGGTGAAASAAGGAGGSNTNASYGGSGGGAAGGPSGVGGAGGLGGNATAGGGGGGAQNGATGVGGSASAGVGGSGGPSPTAAGGAGGVGGSSNAVAGTQGSGGGGGGQNDSTPHELGAAGGAGIDWTATAGGTAGPGGGGGGGGGRFATTGAGGVGGLYGGGGGGGAACDGLPAGFGGNGANGIIVITYTT